MSAVQDLKQRRASLMTQVAEIDAVLRQLGAAGPARRRGGSGRGATPAQLAGLAKARKVREAKLKQASAPKPPVKRQSPLQRARAARAPVQTVSRPASLAAAAEG